VLEAARFYAKHHPTSLPRKTVREVVDEPLESKGNDHKSERYVSDLNSRLGKFAKAFACPVSEITDDDLRKWLVGLKLAPRGRNNFRNNIVLLFNFARKRGYLPKNQPTEAGGLTKAKAEKSDIEIFTPEQLSTLLTKADESLVLYIAIGAFTGLRTAELQRLEWPEVKMDQDVIEVSAKKAKTGNRRLVPIQPNLRAWIQPYVRRQGPVRELVTPADAKKWWAIAPLESGKVVALLA
jgi:integrase